MKTKNIPERITDENGREVLKYVDGVIKDAKTGHIIKPPNETPITRDPAGMQARGQRKKEIARIKGIIRGTGLPMPPEGDIEAMADTEASAIEVLTAVMTNAFMNSQNLRGMAETWNKLTGQEPRASAENVVTQNILALNSEQAERILTALSRINRDVIEAEQESNLLKALAGEEV